MFVPYHIRLSKQGDNHVQLDLWVVQRTQTRIECFVHAYHDSCSFNLSSCERAIGSEGEVSITGSWLNCISLTRINHDSVHPPAKTVVCSITVYKLVHSVCWDLVIGLDGKGCTKPAPRVPEGPQKTVICLWWNSGYLEIDQCHIPHWFCSYAVQVDL